MPSLSRQFAQWIADLQYEDLPPAVIDRAKGVTLQALISVLLGSRSKAGQQAVQLVVDDELGVTNGATLLVDGRKVTKGGAGFANSEMAFSGGKWDTYRMLTHPGTAIIPAALVGAETSGADGRAYLTAVAAAYEVMERLASEFIPTVMSRGFHAGPVFSIFGSGIAAAKLMGCDAEQMNSVIALCASLASSNLEANRSGGRALREGAAVRNALLAVALAQRGHPGGETVLEGEAGFYHAYTGNNHGALTYSFTGATRADLSRLAAGLGSDWMFLETLYRIHCTAGYNIAHIEVGAQIMRENQLRYADVERAEAVVNWLETQYPSPAFPVRREDLNDKAGGTAYHLAYGIATSGFPMLNGWEKDMPREADPPEVLDLMKRITILPSHTMGLFAPRITIFTRDGRSYTKQATGREYVFDYPELVRRMRPVAPGLPIPAAQFDELIAACGALDREARADRLIGLTVKSR